MESFCPYCIDSMKLSHELMFIPLLITAVCKQISFQLVQGALSSKKLKIGYECSSINR